MGTFPDGVTEVVGILLTGVKDLVGDTGVPDKIIIQSLDNLG